MRQLMPISSPLTRALTKGCGGPCATLRRTSSSPVSSDTSPTHDAARPTKNRLAVIVVRPPFGERRVRGGSSWLQMCRRFGREVRSASELSASRAAVQDASVAQWKGSSTTTAAGALWRPTVAGCCGERGALDARGGRCPRAGAARPGDGARAARGGQPGSSRLGMGKGPKQSAGKVKRPCRCKACGEVFLSAALANKKDIQHSALNRWACNAAVAAGRSSSQGRYLSEAEVRALAAQDWHEIRSRSRRMRGGRVGAGGGGGREAEL
eukprot:649354-Prymnesium_polylepis.1